MLNGCRDLKDAPHMIKYIIVGASFCSNHVQRELITAARGGQAIWISLENGKSNDLIVINNKMIIQ